MSQNYKSCKRNIAEIIAVVLITVATVFAVFYGEALLMNVKVKPYAKYVKEYSEEFCVPQSLILAVIKVESDFDPYAVSKAGAKGLMQLMDGTAKEIALNLNEEYDEYKVFDAETNIRYGTYYLSYLLSRFEDKNSAIAAYNAGEGRVKLWLQDAKISRDGVKLNKVPFSETDGFVKKVDGFRKKYQKMLRLLLDKNT